jgi:DNA-binding transcriptional LysR family regulator
MKITLDALEALDAIDRHGSFAGAARALGKVQSAISYAIRQLELGLETELFDRTGHRAVLTGAGQALLEEAREVLARAHRMETVARRFSEGWEPCMEVIIDGMLPMAPIMRVLKQMADEQIPTRIQLKVEFLGGVQDRFEADSADLMLVKDYTASSQLIAYPLNPISVLLVAASNHPLAAATEPLALADLHPHVELTVHDSSTSNRIDDTRLFGGSRVFYLSDFNTKRQGLVMGLGYGWMPLFLIKEDLDAGRLVALDYAPGGRFEFVPSLVHPSDRPLGQAGRRFLELLTAQ